MTELQTPCPFCDGIQTSEVLISGNQDAYRCLSCWTIWAYEEIETDDPDITIFHPTKIKPEEIIL